MKRWTLPLCALLLLVACAHAEDAPKVRYFYENICEACTPEEDFLLEYKRLTGETLSASRLEAYNVFHSAGRQALEDTARSLGIPPEDIKLPMVVAYGTVYMGTSALYGRLPQDALERSGTDTAIVYLYLPACESCGAAEKALDALPSRVSVRRGDFTFDSEVTVRKVDLSAEPQTAYALFERYRVPDEERVAPIVFIGERYLSGAKAIEQSLSTLVQTGRGIGTFAGDDAASAAFAPSAWSACGAMLTGLVAGLNPCALSMLLLFLSTLLRGDRRAGRYAAAFLLTKFACYLLIGTALLGVLQRLNTVWLLPAARWALTLAGGGLAALNVWDAWQVRRGALGRVRNQLPRGIRGWLRRIIALAEKPQRRLLPLVCLLGAAVAAGEFLCAGQVYLASLLSALQGGGAFRLLFPLLALYCAAFILPSVVLCLAVTRSGRWMAASGFLLEHMAAVKLGTALVMLGLIAAAWLV